ncbi:aminoglycoside phosphotransferase family protein [Bradyrhizobium tropiciagri]|uniref:phosphotransferase n=1 Tax=Bradyrhizobium tropiciagri TaxID=312253 RepID=UPI001BA537BC|nr:phosphotransferase [Bradyrhizobium tropiciagri]MBR0871316.1 aminoglycoside phosphotransferase family protein [Bradyrhizobium tropiciagri]
MILSRSNVVHYLLDQGLLGYDSVVDDEVMVSDSTRRNRNFKVLRGAKQGFFIKQVQGWDAQTVATLAAEAGCYRLAREEPGLSALAAIVPRDLLYDAQRHILVTGLLPNAESLMEHHRRLNAFPVEVARLLGGQLGRLHREPMPPLEGRAEASLFRRQPPWALSSHLSGTMFGALSGGSSKLLQILQAYPDFQRTLDEMRRDWRLERLVHGDLKWENCVVYPAGSEDGRLDARIVDWELADIGDPAWDVGGMLQAYICFWILTMQFDGEVPLATVEKTAPYPIARMQPSIRAFWTAYAAELELDPQAADTMLMRGVKYGAARMIQTAYEAMQYSPQISPSALALLQVSLNILKEPKRAATELLGL